MTEVSRFLVALGAVAATVGFTVLGMGLSYVYVDENNVRLGLILMIGGLVGFAVGLVLNRAIDQGDRSAV